VSRAAVVCTLLSWAGASEGRLVDVALGCACSQRAEGRDRHVSRPASWTRVRLASGGYAIHGAKSVTAQHQGPCRSSAQMSSYRNWCERGFLAPSAKTSIGRVVDGDGPAIATVPRLSVQQTGGRGGRAPLILQCPVKAALVPSHGCGADTGRQAKEECGERAGVPDAASTRVDKRETAPSKRASLVAPGRASGPLARRPRPSYSVTDISTTVSDGWRQPAAWPLPAANPRGRCQRCQKETAGSGHADTAPLGRGQRAARSEQRAASRAGELHRPC
jgi:hypothetical protein